MTTAAPVPSRMARRPLRRVRTRSRLPAGGTADGECARDAFFRLLTVRARCRSSCAWPRRHVVGATRQAAEGVSEVDLHDALAADDADELPRRAVDEDEHGEPELDCPEVRPHDFPPQVPVGFAEVSNAPPE